MGIKYNGTQVVGNLGNLQYNGSSPNNAVINSKLIWPACIYIKKNNATSDVKLHTTPGDTGTSVSFTGDEAYISNAYNNTWTQYVEVIPASGYALPFVDSSRNNLNAAKPYSAANPQQYSFTGDGDINLTSVPINVNGYTYHTQHDSVYIEHTSPGGQSTGTVSFFLGSFDVLGASSTGLGDPTKIGTACDVNSYSWSLTRNPTEYKLTASITVSSSAYVTVYIGYWSR